MKQITEPTKTVPVLAETDVLVVDSGPGGLAAALGAAREGIDTMLVERYGCFGGVITQVGVEGIAWYRHERTAEAGGIGTEFERLAQEIGGEQSRIYAQALHCLVQFYFKHGPSIDMSTSLEYAFHGAASLFRVFSHPDHAWKPLLC